MDVTQTKLQILMYLLQIWEEKMVDFRELNKELQISIIKKIDELYVYHIDKYLEQKNEGGYRWLTKGKWISEKILDWKGNEIKHSVKTPIFRKSNIELHLCGDKTYALFAGIKFTKFITFDVDSPSITLSQIATNKLIDVLHTIFRISLEDIHVIFSGKKGYHVTLYFKEPVKNKIAKDFYIEVMRYTEKPLNGDIEFRPTNKQGVKLPLGIHRSAPGKPRCWFVDKNTFEPIQSFEHILKIKPMQNHSCLKNYKKEELPAPIVVAPVSSIEHFQLNEKEKSDLRGFASALIKNKKLTQPGTRHNAMFALSIHCFTIGYSKDYTIQLILDILRNTPKKLIQLEPSKWEIETERIVNLCYEKGYSFKNNKSHIRIYKPEIERILNFKDFKLKCFAFAMLVTGKTYGPLFYFTINTTIENTCLNSRYTITLYREKLVEEGFVEIINKGEIDKEESYLRQHRYFEKTIFELCEIPYTELDPFVEMKYAIDTDTFIKVVYQFFTPKELKKIVGNYQFYAHFYAR